MQRGTFIPHPAEGIKIAIVLEQHCAHDHIFQHTAGLAHKVVDLTAVKDVSLRDFFHLPGTICEWLFHLLLAVFEDPLCNVSKSAPPSPH